MRRHLKVLGLALVATMSLAAMAFAAHLGNSYSELGGTGDPDAYGRAIVNYTDGTNSFVARIGADNLEPGATYTFAVRLNDGGARQDICTATADRSGHLSCSAQDRTLAGFNQAVIYDAAGTEVAKGGMDRRGNCREPEQAGSLCEARGH